MRTRAKLRALAVALTILVRVMAGTGGTGAERAQTPRELTHPEAARVVQWERMQNHAGAIAAWEALDEPRNASAVSGVCAVAYPFAACAFDASAQPERAFAILETLRTLLLRPRGYLQRSPSARSAVLAALADCSSRFTSADCRDLCADILARTGYNPQA